MGSSTSPSLNKILTIAFVINSCCLGLNLTVAKRTSLQRTLDSNFKGKHLASKLISKTDLNSVEQSVKVRTPSKRFHHFLTRTRDVFPIRRSYIKPIRNKDMKDSNLVPVIDHFAGIKAWTVPYSIRDVPTSTTETTVQDKQDWMHTLHTKTPKPTQHTETDRPVPAYSAKEALFDHEYMAYVDVARFAPEVRDAHAGVADERYSKGRWNGYHEPPGRNKPHIFSQFTHNDNSDSKENAQGKHSVQSSLGSFKAVTNSKHSSNGLDLFSFPGKGSFGKFVPDKSKSRDPPVEAGKDHEAGDTDVDDVTHNVLDGKFQPEGFFQSLGAFRNDKKPYTQLYPLTFVLAKECLLHLCCTSYQSGCDNIESNSCYTNDDCSCYGLYKCANGVCTRKSSHQTFTADSSRDETPGEFWHSGPYSKQELGVHY